MALSMGGNVLYYLARDCKQDCVRCISHSHEYPCGKLIKAAAAPFWRISSASLS
jgi:hypothetical protein